MPFLSFRLLGVLVLFCSLLGSTITSAQDANAPTPQQKAEELIRQKLDEPTSVDVIELELSQLVRDIAQRHNLLIVLDPRGLEEVDVSADQPITANFNNVSLRSALRHILRPLQLAAVVRDEALVITSLDCSEEAATVRVIPLTGSLERENPEQILAAIHLAWPQMDEQADPRLAKPRASLLGRRLIVRGSPRQHEMVDNLLESLQSSP